MSSRLLLQTLVALFLILSAVMLVKADGDNEDTNVLVLNDNNFESITAQHDVILVKFYAPWCGHCKALAPKYIEAADILAKDEATKALKLAELDADSQKKIPGKFGITGFPTMKLFRNGEFAEDFEGGRDAMDIVNYMKKKGEAAVNKEITSMSTLKTITKPSSVTKTTLVGYFTSKDGVDYKIWKAVVSQLAASGLEVYHTASPSVLESIGFYGSGSSIQMFRPSPAKPFKVVFRGTIFKQNLREWIVANAVPNVGVYTPDTEKLYALTGKHVVRFVAKDALKVVSKPLLEKLSQDYKNILVATSEEKDYKADMEAHCGKDAKLCVLATENSPSSKKRTFGLPNTFDETKVKEFLESFLAGKLTVKVKSEPAPSAAPEPGDVVKIVGTTFERYMKEDDRSVFIKFFAPWCGHCKQLAPKWETLAKDLSGNFDDVIIAEFNLEANDLPAEYKDEFAVQGFPTLYFAKKGSKSAPVKYEGKREVAELKQWVEDTMAGKTTGGKDQGEAPVEFVPPKAGEVAKIVSGTFSEFLKQGKHVFIKFFAPWCGHCKQLAPKWETLAKDLSGNFDDVIIAEFDADSNQIPKEYQKYFDVQGFPTLYFVKKDSPKKPISYDGGRDVPSLKKFVEEKMK